MKWRQLPAPKAKAQMGKKRPHPTHTNHKKEPTKAVQLSRLHKPPDMTLEEWQLQLRRQFGRQQNFHIKNLGEDPIFSEFEVANPQSKSSYRVRIRGLDPGNNHCSCPDFATNTLGTCKHIEFTLASLERKRGGAARLRAGFQPTFSEIFLHYGARREVRFRPGTDCPASLARLAAKYFDHEGALAPDAFARFDVFLAEAAKLEEDLHCHEDVLAFVAEVRDAELRGQRVAEMFPRGSRSAAFKGLLRVSLYDYQREGVLFAARAGRCLIGDEMGLGKTLQAIATAEVMARLFAVERVLIICPTSLKHQWQREIERFVDRSTEVIGGSRSRRELGFASQTFFKILNYDTVHSDLDLIKRWGADLVILDEAQRIKNWNTRVARSVKRIDSAYALVLTGTPLENRLEELISIVQFVDRFRLGPTFKLLHEHQIRDEVGKVIGYRHLDRIGQTLQPILVRRQKDQVLEQLPERIDTNVFVAMAPLQRKHHAENLELVAQIVQKWRRYRFLSEADRQRLMIFLQRMRMSCDNSYLVDHRSDHGPKADEVVTLLDELFERPDPKVVIFSQWLRMHELIVRRLQGRPWDHVLFHGGVPGTKRQNLIDRFRDDPQCRVFLSTDAGGVGLNLQHASVVVNMDLPWNPAVLEQRIGRVHRLGQRQPVRVINFVAQGTIEEGMLEVLKFKRSLFAGVLDRGDVEVFLGGSRLQKFMEQVEAATGAIPQEMLEDAEEVLRSPADETAAREARPSSQPARRQRRGQPPALPAPVELEESEEETAALALPASPWTGLLQAGMALLQQVSANSATAPAAPPTGQKRPTLLQRDEKTGEHYVRLPLPAPEVLDQALQALGQLLKNLRG